MTVEKPKSKQLLRPITTGAGSAMNQSQFLAITCNSLEAREKSRVHGAIGFDFASHWLKNWCKSFKPITKRSNCNHINYFRQSFENCSNGGQLPSLLPQPCFHIKILHKLLHNTAITLQTVHVKINAFCAADFWSCPWDFLSFSIFCAFFCWDWNFWWPRAIL